MQLFYSRRFFAMPHRKNQAQSPTSQFVMKANIFKLLLSNSIFFKPCVGQKEKKKHASREAVTSGHSVFNLCGINCVKNSASGSKGSNPKCRQGSEKFQIEAFKLGI